MNSVSFQFCLRWLIRSLLNLLLRPMYLRWKMAVAQGDKRNGERFEFLFFKMIDRCNCHPFCIEVDRCGFWILDEPSEPDISDYREAISF